MGGALGPGKPTLTLPLTWQFGKLMPWVWAMMWPDVFYKDASGMCGEQSGRGQRRRGRGQNQRRWWLVGMQGQGVGDWMLCKTPRSSCQHLPVNWLCGFERQSRVKNVPEYLASSPGRKSRFGDKSRNQFV